MGRYNKSTKSYTVIVLLVFAIHPAVRINATHKSTTLEIAGPHIDIGLLFIIGKILREKVLKQRLHPL